MKTRTPFITAVATILVALSVAGVAQAQINFGTIAQARSNTVDPYTPDNLGQIWEVTGRVSTLNFKSTFGGTNAVEIYFQDPADNRGLLLFFPDNLEVGYDPLILGTGKQIRVTGFIQQTGFGVTSIRPNVPSVNIAITDPTEIAVAPVVTTLSALLANPESFEATFVRVSNVTFSGTWPALGGSSTATISDGVTNLALRIDQDTNLDGQLAPTNACTIQGIFTQFDNTAPYTTGYQLMPRYYIDVIQNVGAAPPELVINPTGIVSTAVGQAAVFNLLGRDRNAEDSLTFAAPGAPAGSSLTPLPDRQATFSWTPGAGLEGTTNQIQITLTDGSTTTTGTVTVVVLTGELSNVVLNEIQYDPAGDLTGDANGDRASNFRTDEFVEIVNNNATPVDMSGWVLRVNGVDHFLFPSGTVISGQAAVVVFGGGTPVGTFGGATVFAPSPDWNPGLSNSGATISLHTATNGGVQVFSFFYGGLGLGTDQALTRNPDITGGWVNHLTANPARKWSPGLLNTGMPFPGSGISNLAPTVTVPPPGVVRIGQEIVAQITATDVEMDPISLSVSNAPASAVFVDAGGGSGTLTYTGQVADAGTTFNIIFYANDGTSTSSNTWSLTVPSLQYSGLVINEFMPDPDIGVGIGFDANNDGVVHPDQDEFVEIVNTTTGAVDLAGMILADGAAFRHTFGSFLLPSGGVFVVFGGPSLSNFTASVAATANGTGGRLELNNGGDTILLYSPATTLVDRVDYADPGIPDGNSLTRFPDVTGPFTNHFDLNAVLGTPGRRVDGTPFLQNQPPSINPLGPLTVQTGQSITQIVTAVETDGDSVTMTVSNAPANSTFVDNGNKTATFTFTPDISQVGPVQVTFRAQDIDGFDEETVTITVILVQVGPWDFESGLQGWTTFSVASTNDWARVAGTGAESTGFFMQANGFGSDTASDDWLISPVIDLNSLGYIGADLRYYRHFGFTGPVSDLVLYASTDYTGSGDPNAASWAVVQAVTLPSAQNVWEAETASLDAYLSSSNLYLAFRYITSGTGSSDARRWRLDQLSLVGAAADQPPEIVTLSNQTVTVGNTLNVGVTTIENDGDLVTITASNAPANSTFVDNTDGTASFSFTPAAGQANQTFTVYVTASDKDGSDSSSFQIEVFAAPVVVADPWINEIHYDNDLADTNEGFEVAGPAGTVLTAYSVVLYNGNGGVTYNTIALSGVIPDEGDCYGAVWFGLPVNGLQNGAPDGLALVKDATNVIEFLSYEGVMVASNGPALGLTSVDIGVVEIGTTPVGLSLQLAGSGKESADFTWIGPTNHTRGVLNTAVGQIIVDGCGGTGDVDADGIPDDWESLYYGSPTGAVASALASNGVNTLLEAYIADLNPTNPASVFEITVISNALPNITVRFPSSSNRVYTTQFTTNIVSPAAWTDLETDQPGTGGLKSVNDPSGSPYRDYRARVRVP